jgi:carbon monoxide dehydrogenase subunit G
MKIESKIGTVQKNDEVIYNFLSDFDNFKNLIPEDKVSNYESNGDSCQFNIETLGSIGMKIIEKHPYKLIKITSAENSKFDFFFWIQLKQLAENDTKVKLTIKAELNPMMQMFAKKPLKSFVDTLVDQLATFPFEK